MRRARSRSCSAAASSSSPARSPPVRFRWQLALTGAGMVAVVNSVVVAACAGLVLVAAGVDSFAIPVTAGALVGAGAFALHHRRARDAYSPEAVDRAAILIPPRHPADAA